MNEYIFKGDPKHLENVIREQRIRILRGVVSITTPSESGYITQEESEQKVQAKEDELNAVISEKIVKLDVLILPLERRMPRLLSRLRPLQRRMHVLKNLKNRLPDCRNKLKRWHYVLTQIPE